MTALKRQSAAAAKAAVALTDATHASLGGEHHVRFQSLCRNCITAALARHSAARRVARQFDAASLALAVTGPGAAVPDHARQRPDSESGARSPGRGENDRSH